MEESVSEAESCLCAATREASSAIVGLGAEDADWSRRRLVVGREETSCQPVGDAGRSADGEVMRRRVGTLGAEADVGSGARRRPVAGMAEAAELVDEGVVAGAGADAGAGGYW